MFSFPVHFLLSPSKYSEMIQIFQNCNYELESTAIEPEKVPPQYSLHNCLPPSAKEKERFWVKQVCIDYTLKKQNHLVSEWSWVEQRKSIIEKQGVFLSSLSVSCRIDGHNSLIAEWKRIGLRGKEHCWERWRKPFFVSNWITTLEEIFLISYLILFLFSHWYYLLYLHFPVL